SRRTRWRSSTRSSISSCVSAGRSAAAGTRPRAAPPTSLERPLVGRTMPLLVSTSLTTQRSLDHETLWRALRTVVDRLFGALESADKTAGADTVVDDALDIVVDILGADRGLILLAH